MLLLAHVVSQPCLNLASTFCQSGRKWRKSISRKCLLTSFRREIISKEPGDFRLSALGDISPPRTTLSISTRRRPFPSAPRQHGGALTKLKERRFSRRQAENLVIYPSFLTPVPYSKSVRRPLTHLSTPSHPLSSYLLPREEEKNQHIFLLVVSSKRRVKKLLCGGRREQKASAEPGN